jgi:hypothetical protein
MPVTGLPMAFMQSLDQRSPQRLSMSTAPLSVNTAARPGAWCHGLLRVGSNWRTKMPLPGISSPLAD